MTSAMIRRSQRTFAIALALLPLASGCGSQKAASKSGPSQAASQDASAAPASSERSCTALTAAAPVYYTPDVAGLLGTNCIGCHSGQTGGQTPSLASFAAVVSAANLVPTALAGNMPPSGHLAPAQIQLFAAWQAGGMLQAAGSTAVTPAAPVTPAPCATTTVAGAVPAASPVAAAGATPPAGGSAATASACSGTAPSATYLGGVEQVLAANCVACHASLTPTFTTYIEAEAVGALIVADVASGKMPPAGSVSRPSAAAIALLSAWGAASYPEGTAPACAAGSSASAAPAAPAPLTVADVPGIITGACASCHYAGHTEPDLSSLAAQQARAGEIAAKVGSTGEERMPPSGPLANGIVALIATWAQQYPGSSGGG